VPGGVKHIYFDAAMQDPPKTHWENLIAAIEPLEPDTVVCSLDGDDWLLGEHALARVAAAHAEGAWVTWGSFVHADGRPGFAAPLTPGVPIRQHPWVTTHLKTFRAGLFQRIAIADMQDAAGAWHYYARDMVLMFPCIEMAGPERCRFIPEVGYVYNFANSSEWSYLAKDRAEDAAAVAYVRGLRPYAQIGRL
jgi:hypothetical protein